MKQEAHPHPVIDQKESIALKELKLELSELKNKHKGEVEVFVKAIN